MYECIEGMSRVVGLAPVMLPISGDASCGDSLQHLVKEQAEVMADFVAFVLGGGDEEAVDDEKALALVQTCACGVVAPPFGVAPATLSPHDVGGGGERCVYCGRRGP